MLFRNGVVLWLLVLPFQITNCRSDIYHVLPDNDYQNNSSGNFSLNHFLNHADEYFISDTELHFMPGSHHLQSDLVISNVRNFTIMGENSKIICSENVGIAFINVTTLQLSNISLIYCSRNYTHLIHNVHSSYVNFMHESNMITPNHWIGAMHIHYCALISISNVLVVVDIGVNGLHLINVPMKNNSLINITVQVNCLLLSNTTSMSTNGVVVLYIDWNSTPNSTIVIKNYTYMPQHSCALTSISESHFALQIVLTQTQYNVVVTVQNSIFKDLHNVTVLNFYGESHGAKAYSRFTLTKCHFYRNTNNSAPLLKMTIHNKDIFEKQRSKLLLNHINYINIMQCSFLNNSNVHSLLHIVPINTLVINVQISVRNSNFSYNSAKEIIKVTSKVNVLWHLSYFITFENTNISFNTHNDGVNVLSASNRIVNFYKNITINNNTYYNSIIYLHLSLLKLYGHCKIFHNQVKYVMRSSQGAYYLLKEYSFLTVTQNIVYSVITHGFAYNEMNQEICYFQFTSKKGNLDKKVMQKGIKLNYTIEMIDNAYTAPIHIIETSFSNCTWLADTAFQTTPSSNVFDKIINRTVKKAKKEEIVKIPLSICQCKVINNNTEQDCTSSNIGEIFSGQTLKVKFILPNLMTIPYSSTLLTVINKKLPYYGCQLIDANEISQAPPSHGCNEYKYTLWSTEKACDLFLRSDENIDTFHITLKPCPAGFALQNSSKGCSCDPVLKYHALSITSCNLDDSTIQRPTNSWLSANTVNNSHTYHVSLHCPLDYCLPQSSYINLLYPDSQCQFNRSGWLCGQCQQGLSTVFGSSRCKYCTNYYLFIVLPIAIAGIFLVFILFMFDLTVTNGSINTFIFYVNIISINISIFSPKCYSSVICIMLSLSNLDLGFETCFYDGMTDFAKIWLQLVFPSYLIVIAIVLIVGSRYFPFIQRLTAHKALKVLATLFLLVYTKTLLTICHVLFLFSPITHLPSKHITLMWSVDTSVLLFHIKFSILFAVCMIIFLILLPFNVILVFTRTLSRFKIINMFKPLLDAYFGSYKDQYFYWTGLQLILRAVFFVLTAFNRDVNLTSGIIILGVLLCFEGVVHPFKSRYKNIQESLILLNLLAIYVTALHSNGEGKTELQIINYLIFVVFGYFMLFITYHCVMSLCGNRIKQKYLAFISFLKRKVNAKCYLPKSQHNKKLSSKIPDVEYNYQVFQEPLIALNDY